MRAAALQFAPRFGEVSANRRRVEALAAAASAPFDLLVLPELFQTGYQFQDRGEATRLAEKIPDGATCRFLAELSRRHNAVVVAGLAENQGGKIYNSAAAFSPHGFLGRYRKIHLFHRETQLFSPGEAAAPVLEYGGVCFGLLICFDWIFPEMARSLALRGAQLLCHPANLVLPFCPQAMPLRCLENRLFALTANRTGREDRIGGEVNAFIGQSQLAGPGGEILFRLHPEEEGVGAAEIDPARALDKRLTPENDLFADRRPALYPAQ